MLKYSNNIVDKIEICYVSQYCSKLLLRENITLLDDGRCQYNEYSMLRSGNDNDILISDIEQDFDALIEAAKVEEALRFKENQITGLKHRLESTDYQILKCTESFMLGSVLPYDFSQLLTERNSLRDDINNIQDDVEVDVLDAAKNYKITEMSAICQTTITNGIDYNDEHYRLNTTDQINLTSLYSLAQLGQSVPYHADGQVCRIYTPEEMIGLAQAGTQWIIYHTTYFNLLKHQILEMSTVEEVEAVTYGMELKPEYQSILNAITA